MTVLTSQGELAREALTDAPDGQYIDTILQSYNDFRRNVTSVLQNGSNVADNSTSGEKQLLLTHNVEVAIANPLKVPVRGVLPVQCQGVVLNTDGSPTSSTYALEMPTISWRPNPLSANGGVLVKATFQTPEGIADLRRNATQALASTAIVPVQFTVNEGGGTTSGTTITNGAFSFDVTTTSGTPATNSKITCNAAGFVDLFANVPFDTSVVGAKFAWLSKNNVAGTRWGINAVTVTGYFFSVPVARIQVSAGDYLQVFAYQNTGVSVNILDDVNNHARVMARYAAPALNTTGKINLFFYGG